MGSEWDLTWCVQRSTASAVFRGIREWWSIGLTSLLCLLQLPQPLPQQYTPSPAIHELRISQNCNRSQINRQNDGTVTRRGHNEGTNKGGTVRASHPLEEENTDWIDVIQSTIHGNVARLELGPRFVPSHDKPLTTPATTNPFAERIRHTLLTLVIR